ncbi:hypothetical protein EDB83DRAFT_2317616 [Lactarius deliciosus]|nr:hypothetical protein EDB83DRAFT_2317616 [Lactarius deliciosus]
MSLTDIDPDVLRSVIEHVFLPPKLPQEAPAEEAEVETNIALCHILTHAAAAFHQYLPPSQEFRMDPTQLVEEELEGALTDVAVGDVFVMHVRAQNAAVLIRVFTDHVRFEMFEVSPLASAVMSTNGKLLCSYPGPAVQVSSEIFANNLFLPELASFLIQMDIEVLDSTATTTKAGSTVREVRETTHPRYISELGFPSETLHLMRIKMARRLSKLGSVVSDSVYQVVHDTAMETEELLRDRWIRFQKTQSTSPPWDHHKLDFIGDTAITLNNSRPYLMKVLDSSFHSYSPKPFSPSHQPRLADTVDFRLFSGGRLEEAVANDKRIALADFESSVERHLDSWVDSFPHGDDASHVIASCVEQYFASARSIYGANPEENSVMVLTIMDLWKALDTLAIRQCPLLKFYSPEIPRDFLHPLLLHRSGSLRRAELIEKYILQRHDHASYPTSIFSDSATELSFAVRYYRDSPQLQQLHTDIYQRALREREEKRAELRVLNEKRRSLKDEESRMEHTCYTSWGWRQYCRRCQTNAEADGLNIHVHEWPLPQATLEAQLVVFELSPPRAFSTWREITYKILYDIGTPNAADHAEPKLLLDAYSGLRYCAVRHEYHRITIASTTKSFSDQTHYKSVRIPAGESDVLLNDGLSFKLYDRKANSWAAQSFLGSTVISFCTPPIPHMSSPYHKVHSYVSGTHHTSNEVIAAQADCPLELSLHEYMAFSGLRSGPRLQWLNIARELSSPSLSLRREEVHTLITQAAWQLGPLSDGEREWHTDLGYPSFERTLLKELAALLGRIKANWQEEVTVRTIALLTSRLLSSALDPDICRSACMLLREVRSVVHRWIGELGSKLATTDDEKSRTDLHRRLCILATTCFSTYDVRLEHIPWALSSDSDFSIAVHCAVIVHDNTPPTLQDDGSGYLTRLLNRHRRLLHLLEPILLQGVRSNPMGFDDGLANVWTGFRRKSSSNWHVLPNHNSRWISCCVEGGQEVHLNLLTGQLLIGGNPLGRLPQEIIGHSTYASALGTRILDIIPGDIPGMEFMTRSNVSGYREVTNTD